MSVMFIINIDNMILPFLENLFIYLFSGELQQMREMLKKQEELIHKLIQNQNEENKQDNSSKVSII